VKLNHSSFFSFVRGNKEELSAAEPDPSIIHFGITSLAPGESVTLPLWIRAHKTGPFTFLFLFFYQSEEQNTQMAYRLERITKQLKVLPSLKATTSSNFSYTDIHAYLLDLEVTSLLICNNQFHRLPTLKKQFLLLFNLYQRSVHLTRLILSALLLTPKLLAAPLLVPRRT
jgi:hypothetical protein